MVPMGSHQIARRIFPSIPPISIDSTSGPSGSKATAHLDTPNVLHVHRVSSCDKRHVTIDILPDDVLLQIFHFVRVTCLDPRTYPNGGRDEVQWRLSWWLSFVHVCRKWRSVIFASPNFLNLRLVCNFRTRVGLIDIWPPLPIIIRNGDYFPLPEDYDFDAAIVHRDRVCEIKLDITSSQLQRLSSAMQEQFPALIHLRLDLDLLSSRPTPALPDGFLGGSAPRLKYLWLRSIPFPALPKLLLSSTDLVQLSLVDLPHAGYISPEGIVTTLAVLANLESLTIEFASPLSFPVPGSRRPLPPTRTTVPALTSFKFQGVSEYLEDLVSRIDAPLLDFIWITFFHQLIFDIPLLAEFMRRSTRLRAPNEAHLNLDDSGVLVKFLPRTGAFGEGSVLRISCRVLEWQLSSLVQLITSFFPSIYTVERLYIGTIHILPSQWQEDIENVQWLENFHPFTAVKSFYVSKEFVECVAPALKEVADERVTNVLPALESLFLEGLQSSGSVQEAVGKFVGARQLSGHPVVVSHWNKTQALLRQF